MHMRRIADINEMIDIISSIKGGVFVTLCYISAAKVGKTLASKNIDIKKFGQDLDRNRIAGDEKVYKKLKDYQSRGASRANTFPFGGIVKMTRYQFNWQSENNYRANYNKYATARDKLLAKYGATITHRDSHDVKQEFGKGGVSVGNSQNTLGRLYTHQNGATARNVQSEYYVVDANGKLVGGISYNAIQQLVTKSENINGVSALRKIGASEQQIKQYIADLKKLKFQVLKLMYDRILFLVASVNGEQIYFINTNLASSIESGSYQVKINPKSFINKARELFKASKKEITEALTHSQYISGKQLNEAIQEAVRKIKYKSLKRKYGSKDIPQRR